MAFPPPVKECSLLRLLGCRKLSSVTFAAVNAMRFSEMFSAIALGVIHFPSFVGWFVLPTAARSEDF